MTTLLQFIEQPNGQFLSLDGRLCVVPKNLTPAINNAWEEQMRRADDGAREDWDALLTAARPDVSSCVVGWQPIETAPKDGSRMLWAGKFRAFDILPGGDPIVQIFSYTTIMSDGSGHEWMADNFGPPEQWNVDWTHWMPLPTAPENACLAEIQRAAKGEG